ncbi:MAG: CPBP family intramembrane glutamic endopeptidase [Promethearchaeota archaeon]
MTDSPMDSKDSILQFCPGCGAEIKWNKENRFCMVCGMYLIPFIPKDKIHEWLGVTLTPEEVNELYATTPVHQQPPPQPYPVMETFTYRSKRPWKWGAALGVPLLSVLAKLIGSFVVLLVYMVIVIEDFGTLDIDAFMNEHIVAITIIELVTQVFFILVPFLFTKVFFPYKAPKKERWESLGIPFGLKAKKWLGEIGIGVGFAIGMTVLVYGVQWVSAYLTEWIFGIVTAEDLLLADAGGITAGLPTSIWFFALYSLLMIVSVGPAEEVLFRGFTQKGIQDSFKNPKLGRAMGLIITAIYFTLFHIYSFLFFDIIPLRVPLFFFTFIPYFSLSLVLGFLYMWRKNLISAITAHALYNIIQFLIIVIAIA